MVDEYIITNVQIKQIRAYVKAGKEYNLSVLLRNIEINQFIEKNKIVLI